MTNLYDLNEKDGFKINHFEILEYQVVLLDNIRKKKFLSLSFVFHSIFNESPGLKKRYQKIFGCI